MINIALIASMYIVQVLQSHHTASSTSVSHSTAAIFDLLYEVSSYTYYLHMREQYILQPTESSPGTGNSSPQRQRMAAWSGDTQAAGGMLYS